MLEGDIYDLLAADATLVAAATGGIYTGPVVPLTTTYPAILIRRSASAPNDGATRCGEPADLATVDVHVWGDRGHSVVDLEAIADRIHRVLYRQTVSDGWLVVGSGPLRAPDDDGYPGYVVQVVAYRWEDAI